MRESKGEEIKQMKGQLRRKAVLRQGMMNG